MSSSQEKKRKTGGSSGGAQHKRGAEQDLDVPTLGQVAEEGRFEPLRELLKPVKDAPVNEFLLETREAAENRVLLKEQAANDLLWNTFVTACRAQLEAAHKRAHMASEEHSPGKQQRWLFFFLFLSFSRFRLFALLRSLFWAPRYV
jgi:hypothetical protein